jgi:hypothetical protein
MQWITDRFMDDVVDANKRRFGWFNKCPQNSLKLFYLLRLCLKMGKKVNIAVPYSGLTDEINKIVRGHLRITGLGKPHSLFRRSVRRLHDLRRGRPNEQPLIGGARERVTN